MCVNCYYDNKTDRIKQVNLIALTASNFKISIVKNS